MFRIDVRRAIRYGRTDTTLIQYSFAQYTPNPLLLQRMQNNIMN